MRTWRLVYVLVGLVLLAAPLLSANALTAQGQVTVTLAPLSVGVAESGVLEGQIACPSGGCASFEIVLNFDRDKIHLDSAAVGPFLGSQVMVELNRIDNVLGVAWLTASTTAPPPAGASVLFTLTISGLIPGSAAINVNALTVKDVNGAPLPSSGQGTTVTVNETGKIAFFSPPANGWEVAFVAERDGNPEIYKMFADGSNVQRLTDNPALDRGPKWSPDGSRIAFYSERDGNREIYLMNADGSNVHA